MASRLGRLSKARNALSHPDLGIHDDLLEFVDARREGEKSKKVVNHVDAVEAKKVQEIPEATAGVPAVVLNEVEGRRVMDRHPEAPTVHARLEAKAGKQTGKCSTHVPRQAGARMEEVQAKSRREIAREDFETMDLEVDRLLAAVIAAEAAPAGAAGEAEALKQQLAAAITRRIAAWGR